MENSEICSTLAHEHFERASSGTGVHVAACLIQFFDDGTSLKGRKPQEVYCNASRRLWNQTMMNKGVSYLSY